MIFVSYSKSLRYGHEAKAVYKPQQWRLYQQTEGKAKVWRVVDVQVVQETIVKIRSTRKKRFRTTHVNVLNSYDVRRKWATELLRQAAAP